MYYVLILASWFVFGLIHSLTASTWLKQTVALRLGWLSRYYRLLYNAIALLTFLPVLWLHWKAPVEYVSTWQGTALVGLPITMLGAGIALIALWGYDLGEFIGWHSIVFARNLDYPAYLVAYPSGSGSSALHSDRHLF